MSAIYGERAAWYPLLDPADAHADEAACYRAAFERAVPDARTLLELGSGAGNNAVHLRDRFECTLVDLSEPMLALSRAQSPRCEHHQGDLRTARLGRTFDVVLLHDAVAYMTSERDLSAAMETAFVHTRPGGAAILAPDLYRETFAENVEPIEGDDGVRALRGLAWVWDPDPDDDTYVTDYVFVMREAGRVEVLHERHVEGLFAEATWLRLAAAAGFRAEWIERPIDDEGGTDRVLLCRRDA